MYIQIYCLIIGFILSLIIGYIFIPMLTRLKVGQVVRDDGPKTHLGKNGTPTMGGVIILLAILLVSGLYSLKYPDILPILMVTLGFGIIGFIDDYIKIVLKRSMGLRAWQKMLGLLIISTVFVIYLIEVKRIGTEIYIPFFNLFLDIPKLVYIPFAIIVMLASTNSLNLTDGLDGLATGVTVIIMAFFTIVSMAMEDMASIIFCSTLTGACLGFLTYNINPAKVFMGDTGSLALGGAFSAVALYLQMPLILLIVAGVCVLEALSVIIQVAVFKKTGKRVFKMAPLHHHFELCGWSEMTVVWFFWGLTILLSIIGLISFK